MPDKGWKQFERRVARFLGGKRRGAYTGNGHDGGKTDIVLTGWAVECKLLGRPAWSHFLGAVKQAEANAEVGEIPVAIVKKTRANDIDTLVVMRLDIFKRLTEEILKADILCLTPSDGT